MKKRSVNLVVWSLGVGGIEVTLINYVRYLTPEFEFTVYSLRPRAEENVLGDEKIKVVEGSHSTLETYKQFYEYAKEHRDEAFHLFNGGQIVLSLARLAGVKNIIYHFHGTRYWKPNKLLDKLKSKLLWRIALAGDLSEIQFVANSNYSRRRFYEQISKKPNIGVVYNGFDNSKFSFQKIDAEDEFKIVVVGRLIDYKNLLRLIRESPALFRKIPNCRIYFIGTGNFESTMRAEIEKLGLQDRFVFTGYLSSYEQMYKDASAVLSVSYNESFGNTLVEAVLSGTPIFASDIPAHKEILEPLPESIIKLESHIGEQVVDKVNNIDVFKEKVQDFRPLFIQRFSIDSHIKAFRNYYSR